MIAALECQNLTVGYGGTPVVRDLSLMVEPGEIVALLGPNGAGKTTTLLALSGLLAPMSGCACLFGRRVPAGRPHLTARWGLAHVPDDRALFLGLTTRENLRLGLAREARAGGIERIVDFFPALGPLLNRRAGLLSGGEQQMLALGRALAGQPRALMVDEMSMGLAPIIVERLLPAIQRIARETDTAVLLVEQHVDLALQIADRAYVITHGDLMLTGTGDALSRRRDLLQACYLGEKVYEELK